MKWQKLNRRIGESEVKPESGSRRVGESEQQQNTNASKDFSPTLRLSDSPALPFPRLPDSGSAVSGFTLIELLIVITIIGMMFSVSVPISYSMYQRYQASLEAEKILTLVSSIKMEAFLHGQDKLIESKDGKIIIDGAGAGDFKDIFIQIDKPIKFYRPGTTSGGEIKIYAGDNTFVIEVQAPLGGIVMKTS